jgi:hypothetical protein
MTLRMLLASMDGQLRARAVTDTYNNDGFAKAMERFVLGSIVQDTQ